MTPTFDPPSDIERQLQALHEEVILCLEAT